MGEWAGQPNNFMGKIWAGLARDYEDPIDAMLDFSLYGEKHVTKFSERWSINAADTPKLHTIRAGNRWEAGMDIHFAINPRSKNYFQFAPVIPCVSVQEIEIIHTGYSPNTPAVYIHNGKSLMNPLSYSEIETLAQNDGFDSVEQFFAWFNKDFKGQLIHWSNHTY